MTRFIAITSLGVVVSVAACGAESTEGGAGGAGGAGATSGTGGSGAGAPGGKGGGPSGSTTGGSGGTGGGAGGGVSLADGGTGGPTGAGGTAAGGASAGGGTGMAGATGAAGISAVGGSGGTGPGGSSGGASGSAGATGAAGSGTLPNDPLPPLVTSSADGYWKTDGALSDSTATANVTVNDAAAAQKWDGFGGAFNELGWSYLTSSTMQAEALRLLFSASDGAAFVWGRIPMGASDYAMSRYTCDDTGTDVMPMSNDSNRPPEDTALASFSLARDGEKLIPYIKAAQAVNPALRFWASPWTPPVWMKTGYKTSSGADSTQNAKRPSYFDGGNMKSDAAVLSAYAEYYKKFVSGYKQQGINIELVSPQNEPGYDQNYPSCLWDKAVYTSWIKSYLGPAMQSIGVQVMLGTLSNAGDSNRTDLDIATAVLADSAAKGFVSVVGAQWGVLDKVNSGTTFSGLPVWATEHKCGNYPWCTSASNGCYAAYNSAQAPNDQAYGVETWDYISKSITKGKVTAYNAWNMVLDKSGLGIDTTRDWKQNALLVADGGKVSPTPAYYVFRHFSQYVHPGATVVGTTGGDAVAFKNSDGTLVAVLFNKDAANPNYVVSIGGKKLAFAMPGYGWATVQVKP